MFVLIKGGLGSGKTTFVKNVLKEFTKEMVVSPTFSYMNKYSLNKLAVANAHHIDMYKFTHKERKDKEAIDFITSTVENDSGLFFVEWPTEPIVFAAIELGNVLYINIKNEHKCTLSLIMSKRMTKAIQFDERRDNRIPGKEFNRAKSSHARDRDSSGSWKKRESNELGRKFNKDRASHSRNGRYGNSRYRGEREKRNRDLRDFGRDRSPNSKRKENNNSSWERRSGANRERENKSNYSKRMTNNDKNNSVTYVNNTKNNKKIQSNKGKNNKN